MGSAYSYLLGIYLGDGCLSQAPRGVWKLRISMDSRYHDIITGCKRAIYDVSEHLAGEQSRQGCKEIYSNRKHWLCLFPQHGPGVKHRRTIGLEDWQWQIVERFPAELLRGLIHSDGCRVTNRVRRPLKGGVKSYEYTRYFFTNHSEGIRAIFAQTCDLLGVECRPNNRYHLSVAKRESVVILDSFIGPKS